MRSAEREAANEVEAIVWRHGWNATSLQTLDPGYAYFLRGDGCVAYMEARRRAWVAAGAPIAGADRLAELGEAFVRAARDAGRRCCFFAAEERFLGRMGENLDALRIGEQPVWDPRGWDERLAHSRSLREQLRRARAKGVRVRRLPEDERAHALPELRALTARWLHKKTMAPMGFLVRVFPEASHRACFVAEAEGRILAFALVLPVPARGGWFLESLVRDPAAPNGSAELLVDAVMRWAAEGGSRWLTLGLAPLAGDVGRGLETIRRRAAALYDFEGLRRFKAKLGPDRWEPIHLAFPRGQGPWVTVVDVLGAFAAGGFLPFGLRTLLRS